MSTLLPCPACPPPGKYDGFNPIERIAARDVSTALSQPRWQLYCSYCLCAGPNKRCLDDAIKAWNEMPRAALPGAGQ